MATTIKTTELNPFRNPHSFYGRFTLLITGFFFGLVFSKGGNPVIFADKILTPSNFFEFLFQPFPFSWFYLILPVVLLLNITYDFNWSRFTRNLLILLPIPWIVWQILASFQTVDLKLTSQTVYHFLACVACFYIGFIRKKDFLYFNPYLYIGVLSGLLWVIGNGFDQRFGGLEALRQNFERTIQSLPPDQRLLLDTYEFRVKIMSNRIFSTFVYPNALAGGLLILTPAITYFVYKLSSEKVKTPFFNILFPFIIILSSLVCLYWSGSKAGLIIAALIGVVLLFLSKLPEKIKIIISIILIVAAGGVIAFKYSDYFLRGAKSIGARFDYWNAAIKTALSHPIFGTGPGTFSISYRLIKPPEAEMARLAHNDFIEQASDSGIPGMIFYLIFVATAIICGFKTATRNRIILPYWVGFFAWSLHSCLEFHLYIPAIAYFAFASAGVLSGSCREEDEKK